MTYLFEGNFLLFSFYQFVQFLFKGGSIQANKVAIFSQERLKFCILASKDGIAYHESCVLNLLLLILLYVVLFFHT